MSDLERAMQGAIEAGDFEAAYEIEQQLKQAAPPPPEQRGWGEEAARQLGLTGRAVAGSAAQMLEPFDAPVRYLLNKALPGDPFVPLEQATDQALTQAGVPEPETAIERGVQDASRFVGGFAGGMGLANKADDAVLGALNLAKRAPAAAAPTTSQLRQQAKAAYTAADDAGLAVNPESFRRFSSRLAGIVKHEGMDAQVHPKASAAMNRILADADAGKPLKLKDLETLRKVTRGAKKSIEPEEQRIGSIITDELDDYLNRMGGSDILAGDPKAASESLNMARNLWGRMRKTETVQEAVEKAGIRAGQFSGSGFENALRTQFRQIAMNNKRMRGFSQEEQAAIKKIAMGGPIDNAFRSLGKLAPTGVVSAGMSSGAGYAVGGPVGAMALPAIGGASRKVATKMTEKNVANLDEMVRTGQAVSKKGAPEWLLPWLSGAALGTDTQGED